MARHILLANTDCLGDYFLDALRILCRHPSRDLTIPVVCQRDGGLHGCMCQVRDIIFGFDCLFGSCEFDIYITFLAHHQTRPSSCFLKLLLELIRIVGGILPVFPNRA